MANFCKLFDDGPDQVLVLRDVGKLGPRVRIYFDPKLDAYTGLCVITRDFPDTNAGHVACNIYYQQINSTRAYAAVRTAKLELGVK